MCGSHRFLAIKISREPETSRHRNVRARRQVARGVIAADKLGFNIDEKVLVGAQKRLAAHHGTPAVVDNTDKVSMNQWHYPSPMEMMHMIMESGGYGGVKGGGGKGKGGKGAKAWGGGKASGKGKGGKDLQACQPCGYDDLAWRNPQPAHPCPRCGSKDHYKNQCPHRNTLCEACNKYGHTSAYCKAGGGLQPCACCGKDNHKTADCKHKTKTCNTCKQVGHLSTMCPSVTKDEQKQAGGTPAAQGSDDPNREWWCTRCCELNLLKCCTKCKKKRDLEPEEEVKPLKPQAETVLAWEKWTPDAGDMDMDPADQEKAKEKKRLEDGVIAIKGLGAGFADALKTAEENLKNFLKKMPVHSLENDCVSVSKSLQDAKGKAARITAQAEKRLEKKEAELSDMEKANAAAVKQMKEDYERRVQLVQKQFEKDKKKLEEEVGQEKVKLEETKKEQEANVNKAKTAFGNVAAATTGASQKLENGQPSAAPAVAPGAVLVAAVQARLFMATM